MLPIKEILDSDVLIEGGGVAGLMCAISAAQAGARVIVLEKAHAKRSGSGAGGNDHFNAFIPEVHTDREKVRSSFQSGQMGKDQDRDMVDVFLDTSYHIIRLWETWGIKMRPTGDWVFEGHKLPGDTQSSHLKYDGSNQKNILTTQALKVGATIINHSPVLDILLTQDGRCAGLLALCTDEEKPSFRIVRAKAAMLATGNPCRLFLSANTPGLMFNSGLCPACTGESIAQFWRVGGVLVGMDRGYRHAGPRFISRCGKATWIGVYRYPDGTPIGPFLTKPDREHSDIIGDIWNSVFTDLMANGRGPALMDCAGASPEDIKHMLWAMRCEGMTSFIDQMKAESVDPARHAVLFGQYEPTGIRGIEINTRAETNIPGIFAAGDHVGNFRANVSGAAVYGWIGGQTAAAYVPGQQICHNIEQSEWAQSRMRFYSSFAERPQGATWQECNHAVQQILSDFASVGPHKVRSETLLSTGLKFLGDLRRRIRNELSTPTAHELMRAAETLAIVDIGEGKPR